MIISNDPVNELLELTGFSGQSGELLSGLTHRISPKYLRDLKLNLKSTLKSDYLAEKESLLLALSLAVNSRKPLLQAGFEQRCRQAGATDEQIGEAIACASLMAANNVFYRFRHVMQNDSYNNMPARFRMSIMMNPANGKEMFELMSLAISAVNGCEMCVRSHEESLRSMGCSQERIFESIRMASVMESLARIF